MLGNEETLGVVASNAKRLLSDAEFLAAGGRFPTAVALAVLAIEEVGKYFFLKWNRGADSPDKTLRRHVQKQLVASSLGLAEVMLQGLEEALAARGYKLQHPSQRPEGQSAPAGTLSFDELSEEFESEIITAMATAAAESDIGKVQILMRNGTVDKIKQLGLYVDVDSAGLVTSRPDKFSEADSILWISRAQRLVSRLP